MEEQIQPTPSRPLHVQRVEQAVDLTCFLKEQEKHNATSTSTDDDQSIDDDNTFNSINILSGMLYP